MKTNPNEPIVPYTNIDDSGFVERRITLPGLTKREHFAAMAMQGWMSAVNLEEVEMNKAKNLPVLTAKWAVAHADALIEALNKEEQ